MSSSKAIRCLVTVLITVGMLYSYNDSRWPDRSRTQINFDKWLQETESKLLEAEISELSDITIMYGQAGDAPLLTLSSSLSGTKVIRILDLAKEANIFSSNSDDAKELFYLKVSGPKNFMIEFSPEEIENNPKAALMLKLFQVYAQNEVQIRLLAKTKENTKENS